MEYKVGSIVEYAAFGGTLRTVRITAKHADVKNGRPGFDAEAVGEVPEYEKHVWGYDYQIKRVISQAVARG